MCAKRSYQDDAPSKKAKTSSHWSLGLLDSINDPANIVHSDDFTVAIKDKYPKAEFHYLVMPKENIPSLKSITTKNADLLKHMEKAGEHIAKLDMHKNKKFNFGYHAEASMSRLHLHVISDDMNSPCLKTKKHWNSFTTAFFMHSKAVREQLEVNGKIQLLSKDILKEALNKHLQCHKCDFKPKNIPDLKKHLLTHCSL